MGNISSAAHLQQALKNIAGDSRLNDVEKDVAATLANQQHGDLGGDADGNPSVWDDAMLGLHADLQNPAEPFAAANANERLGNVCTRRALSRAISSQLRCNDTEAARLISLILVESGGSALTKDEVTDLQEMRDRVRLRAGNTVWLFQNDNQPVDPFAGSEMGDLPCRLGLPYQVDEEFLAFTVPAAVVENCHRPCVYDPGWHYQELWRPTGRTKPVCVARPVAEGHREWLGTPPTLADIDHTVRLAVVLDCKPVGTDCYD